MGMKVLWIDDEYNRYTDLISTLEKKDIHFDFAETMIDAKKKLEVPDDYDALIIDLILREGKDYTLEEIKQKRRISDYWGMVLLEELHSTKQHVPKIIILTVVRDARIHTKIKKLMKRKKIITEVLNKGVLKKKDVQESLCIALNKT